MNLKNFTEKVASINITELAEQAKIARANIITMTTLAESGHPGGSLSSIDMLMAIYSVANISKDNLTDIKRDKIVVSHGHISPAVYSALAYKDILNIDNVISGFRKAGSLYEGHIERSVDGVEWTTGNLGQGLSVAAGFAISDNVNKTDSDVYLIMGDGEQQKGQIAEARRFISKYNLTNITTFIDFNELQISGDIHSVMPSLDIAKSFEADGFEVLYIDGHDFNDIFSAMLKSKANDKPTVIIAKTIMGKGIPFIENKEKYHGSTLSIDEYKEALSILGCKDKLDYYKELREKVSISEHIMPKYDVKINTGNIIEYDKNKSADNRSAFGNALLSVVESNINDSKNTPIVVFDCDLSGSVKTDQIANKYPDIFYQAGIAEHNASVMAGSASANNLISVFADFGMFGVDEVYNQQRLNGINESNLKLVTTHVGTDVGEDGKTHQCIDYLALMRNIFGFKVITPADPNQTDRAVRFALSEYGNIHVAMGRSKLNPITDSNGEVFFNKDYKYEYGKIDIIREGNYPIFTYGAFVEKALQVHEILKTEAKLSTAVINISSPLHIDDKRLQSYLMRGVGFIYEDHISDSGLFSTMANIVAKGGYRCKLLDFGLNRFPMSGAADEILVAMELDPISIAKKIRSMNLDQKT